MCFLCSGIGFVRLLADYNQVDGNSFLEADLQNNFMGITGVRVNRDRGRYLNNINSSTLTVKLLGIGPSGQTLTLGNAP